MKEIDSLKSLIQASDLHITVSLRRPDGWQKPAFPAWSWELPGNCLQGTPILYRYTTLR